MTVEYGTYVVRKKTTRLIVAEISANNYIDRMKKLQECYEKLKEEEEEVKKRAN